MIDLDRLSQQDICQRLKIESESTYDLPPEVLSGERREAAVLIPFLRKQDAWHILYIRRAELEGDRHSGQVAFAGGKRELDDRSLEMTALREAQEEVGFQTDDVTILGRLNQHHTISNFQVTPYVGLACWPYPLVLEATEVARAFTIPLTWLANASHYQTQQRHHQDSRPWPVVYYQPFDGELLWGATARMTLSLIDALSREHP